MTRTIKVYSTIPRGLATIFLPLLLIACGGGAESADSIGGDLASGVVPVDGVPVAGAAVSGIDNGGLENTESQVVESSGNDLEPGNAGMQENQFPEIVSMSLGCDLVLESVAIKVGESAAFTLEVNDESPSTLVFSATTDNPQPLDVSVGNDGIITLIGLSSGDTNISVLVTDEFGKQDELLLNVIIDA